jgi:homoserine dehydrogenase
LFINPDKILNVGIQNLSENDIRYAREKNFRIKLVPTARKISTKQVVTYVLPKFVKSDDFLFNVENEYNGVTVQAAFADKQFFFGKGAGGHPTGAAVLSDIAALRYGYRYEYKKYHQHTGLIHTDNVNIEVYLRYTHEYTIDKLKIENISERFTRDDYKYVIGSVSLKSLLANWALLEQKDVFIAHTGKYTYTEQQIKTVADEEALVG